jgi:hypothetical protein
LHAWPGSQEKDRVFHAHPWGHTSFAPVALGSMVTRKWGPCGGPLPSSLCFAVHQTNEIPGFVPAAAARISADVRSLSYSPPVVSKGEGVVEPQLHPGPKSTR